MRKRIAWKQENTNIENFVKIFTTRKADRERDTPMFDATTWTFFLQVKYIYQRINKRSLIGIRINKRSLIGIRSCILIDYRFVHHIHDIDRNRALITWFHSNRMNLERWFHHQRKLIPCWEACFWAASLCSHETALLSTRSVWTPYLPPKPLAASVCDACFCTCSTCAWDIADYETDGRGKCFSIRARHSVLLITAL